MKDITEQAFEALIQKRLSENTQNQEQRYKNILHSQHFIIRKQQNALRNMYQDSICTWVIGLGQTGTVYAPRDIELKTCTTHSDDIKKIIDKYMDTVDDTYREKVKRFNSLPWYKKIFYKMEEMKNEI